jgi:hypothetical protein
MEGSTIAEIRTSWDAPPTQPGQTAGGTVFDSTGTIARIIILASDGIVTIEPPLTGSALPAVRVTLPIHDEEEGSQ